MVGGGLVFNSIGHELLGLTLFGLGDGNELAEVLVRWPDGTEESIGTLAGDQLHTLTQGQGATAAAPRKP